MAVPSTVADLDAVASNNSPAGSEPIGTNLDDYLRAHAAIIKQVSNTIPTLSYPAAGMVKSTGSAWALASAGTDYLSPAAIGVTVQSYDAQLSSLIQQNSKSAAYTCVLTDSGKHILHPSADTTARVFTIPANSSVAYPIGTALTFINQNAAGVITISITTDTMRLAGAGTTGSRTLAANGLATAIKITSTEWIISGSGLT